MRKTSLAVLLLVAFSCHVFAGMQEDREEFIDKQIKQGIFQKIEVPANLPNLWVEPSFHALNFDVKQQVVNVVYSYYITKDKKYNMVIIYDSKTGKEIGVYDETNGGLKLH
jgi:hypothetical protein